MSIDFTAKVVLAWRYEDQEDVDGSTVYTQWFTDHVAELALGNYRSLRKMLPVNPLTECIEDCGEIVIDTERGEESLNRFLEIIRNSNALQPELAYHYIAGLQLRCPSGLLQKMVVTVTWA